MEALLRRLTELTRKAVKLEKQLQSLQQEKIQLQAALEAAQSTISASDDQSSELKEKYEALKLAKSIEHPDDRDAVMSKIDLYLKEIDICLKTLGD